MAKTKRRIRSFFLHVVILLGILLLFSVIIFYILSSHYKNWERDIGLLDMTKLDLNTERSELEGSLERKIMEYNEYEGDMAVIQLEKEEALLLFSQSLNESLPDGVEIERLGLIPSHGNWYVYVSGSFFAFDLPWIGFNLQKDDVQSIDVYVDDMFLGDVSFERIFLGSVVESVNTGIQNSLNLVDGDDFAGRVFENIELTDKHLIIRSRRVD